MGLGESGEGLWKIERRKWKFLLFFLLIFGVILGVFTLAFGQKIPSPKTHLSPPLTVNSSPISPLHNPSLLSPNSSLQIPILVYHHIGKPSRGMTSAEKSFFIEPEWFEKHLQYLAQNNFQTVKFSDVADYFEKGVALPESAVIISFDDGWKSAVNEALPLLQKYNMTATVFIPTKLITEKPGKGMRMSWGDIEKLRDAEWEIGSHSLWHPYLSKTRRLHEEIFESKKVLEEKLGITVTAFAYPFGDYNEQIEKIVREAGYTTARSFTSGKGITRENLFHMPVVRVYANVGMERWLKN